MDRVAAVPDVRRRRADRARQVADLLRRQIVHGQVARGQLPLEAALAREFGVSRNTVREALDLLRDEGLVERCPGVGTTVAAEKYPHGLHRLLGLAERRAAATGLRELVEVLPATPELGAALSERLASADAVVRATGLDVLLGKPSGALAVLAADGDPLVRAAALESSGTVGQPLEAEAVRGLKDADWQVRVGAARCLGAADRSTAVEPLVAALSDANLDVRKASVLALTPWAASPEVGAALRSVLTDADADVRAYARRALADLES
ncbi:GntR family transcriptional regulator [Nonomuraea mangrovi]|uniref:GntR family transcriptional regulator n=1 Tax=Nonomuraea mangrovi TaxID=2316207 RepID=A0ABW4T2R0_9ACTN